MHTQNSKLSNYLLHNPILKKHSKKSFSSTSASKTTSPKITKGPIDNFHSKFDHIQKKYMDEQTQDQQTRAKYIKMLCEKFNVTRKITDDNLHLQISQMTQKATYNKLLWTDVLRYLEQRHQLIQDSKYKNTIIAAWVKKLRIESKKRKTPSSSTPKKDTKFTPKFDNRFMQKTFAAWATTIYKQTHILLQFEPIEFNYLPLFKEHIHEPQNTNQVENFIHAVLQTTYSYDPDTKVIKNHFQVVVQNIKDSFA